ncbi:unnamed protein product [Coccothraustes coccothraustes]
MTASASKHGQSLRPQDPGILRTRSPRQIRISAVANTTNFPGIYCSKSRTSSQKMRQSIFFGVVFQCTTLPTHRPLANPWATSSCHGASPPPPPLCIVIVTSRHADPHADLQSLRWNGTPFPMPRPRF